MYTKYEENPCAGFFNTTNVGKIFGNFLKLLCWSLIFKIKVMHAYDLRLTPLIHFGLKYIFV